MCDYSLMHLPNRLAREGEELVIHRFPSGSKGLASPTDLQAIADPAGKRRRSFWAELKDFFAGAEACPVPAVCIPPGARLRLHGINQEFQQQYGVSADEDVKFEQLTAAPNTYRDAFVFRHGVEVKLQYVPEGQKVTVCVLTANNTAHPEATVMW